MIIGCIGLRRSGSTLQYNLIKSCLDFKRLDYVDFGFVSEKDQYEVLNSDFVGTIVIFKSHRVDSRCLSMLNKIFYIERDIRDVFASQKLKWNTSVDDFVQSVNHHLIHYSSFKSYDWVLRQKYEELLDSHECVLQIARFLSLSLDSISALRIWEDNSIEKVKSSIDQMNRQNRLRFLVSYLYNKSGPNTRLLIRRFGPINFLRKKFRRDFHDRNTLYHWNHIGRFNGKPGQWKYVLDAREIAYLESNLVLS